MTKAKNNKKNCSYPHCTHKAVQASVCRHHGAPQARRCGTPGCSNVAIRSGVCQSHGAKKKMCNYPGCGNLSQSLGVCRNHGAPVRSCSVPECTNNAVNSGVCRRHGATVRKCGIAYCTKLSAKGGVCRRHGAAATKCKTPFCTNNSKRYGLCRRHGAYRPNIKAPPGAGPVCAETQEIASTGAVPAENLETGMHEVKQALLPPDEPVIHSQSAVAMASETESPLLENHLSLQQMHDKDKFSYRNSRENEEIDMDTILQLPFCITYNFRKVGFAKFNNVLKPVLFLGPNDAPAFVRKKWKILFSHYLRHGAPMVHVVAIFGQKKGEKKFGLVTDAYLYDYALEAKFRMIPEKEISRKLLKGEILDESDLQFHRALAELSFARRQHEDDRWEWKTPRFMF